MDTMRPGIEDIKKTQMEPLEMTKSKTKNTPHGTNSWLEKISKTKDTLQGL